MKLIALILLAYIFGSIPTGLIIGKKFFNIDIREHGSKNIGGTNSGRVLGKRVGLIVSILDILKVFLPTLVANIFLGVDYASIIGLFGMLGHCYPVFANFRGGKGVSSFLGIVFALNFFIGILVVIIWKILKHLTNYVSVASMLSCFAASFIFLFKYGLKLSFYTMFAGAVFVVYLHRANIKRLLNHSENKVNPNR